MPKISARIVYSYVLAVGLPLLVLVGVFKTGRSLKPPMYAGGSWHLETGAMCGASSLVISQTGRLLNIALAGHAAVGTIDGDTVRFSGSQPPCVFAVVAKMDRTMQPPVLAGRIEPERCESCPAAPFRAVWSDAPAGSR